MTIPTAPQPSTQSQQQVDWPGLIVTILLYGWMHLTLLASHWIVWAVEQFTVIEGSDWPVWVWPAVALGHVALLLVPLAPLAWFWRKPRYRAVFQTWVLGAVFILFLLPARFAPPNRAQLAAVLQIVGVLDLIHVRYTPYYLVNAIEVKGGPLLRLWLITRPEVDRILDSPILRPLPAPIPQTTGSATAPGRPQWNLTNIGADRVWREFGVTGEGITVGQSDSGVQWDHPELRAAYRGSNGDHDYNWLDPWHHTTEPTDIGGHGTHTLGSVLGQSVGVAPGAEWYGCANLARNLGNPALYLDCMQFMLAPFPLSGDPLLDGGPTRGAHVINSSWGCPDIEGCDPQVFVDAVHALRAAGVFVVASAGNEGSTCGSVRDPLALYDGSFSVGAVDERGRIASFSSRGPVTSDGSNRIKPDIMAPGVGVLSAYPDSTYESASGTSMAGPHVAGVVALVWSANPGLIGNVKRTEQILIETAQPYDYARHGPPLCGESQTYPNNAVGYGLVDAYAAVKRALEETPPP